MGRRLEARQLEASSSGQGTARLAGRKLLPHVRLDFRYGQANERTKIKQRTLLRRQL